MGRITIGGHIPIIERGGAVATAVGDVCLTPTPTGPIPVPYVNLARAKHLRKGTCRITIRGSKVMVRGSQLGSSTGDELGHLGGVLSKTTRGIAEALTASEAVRFEGQGVICDGAIMLQNRRNAVGRIRAKH